MKNTCAIIVLIVTLLSCEKQEAVQPVSLIGNWKTIPNGQPNLRWTFGQTEAYQAWDWWDKPAECQPVTPSTSAVINKYTVRNDTLIFEFSGQFNYTYYVYYPIKTLTQDRLVISRYMAKEQDSIFERCP